MVKDLAMEGFKEGPIGSLFNILSRQIQKFGAGDRPPERGGEDVNHW